MTAGEHRLSQLKRAWGTSPEVFLLTVITALLIPLNLFGVITSPAKMINVILGALTIFNIAFLRQREQLSDLHSLLDNTSNNMLLDTYPSGYLHDLGRGQELWITGNNLRRIFPEHIDRLNSVIKRGGTINAVLVGDGNAIKYAAQQDLGPKGESSGYIGTIDVALFALSELGKSGPGKVHIHRIDYPLPFGIDAVDVESPDGVIYVRFYPFFDGRGDKPILVLRPHQSQWFNFYKQQLSTMLQYRYDAKTPGS